MKLQLLLVLLFTNMVLFAQAPFSKGFIITKDNQKISGLIANKSSKKMSNGISIKQKGKWQYYKAADLKSVSIGKDEIYESHIVKVNKVASFDSYNFISAIVR